jgi:hypothetical protein
MNDAFLASNDSIEVEQNANDGDDTAGGDDRVEANVEENKTNSDAGDFYNNIESESLETNLSHLILIMDCLYRSSNAVITLNIIRYSCASTQSHSSRRIQRSREQSEKEQ